jgi:polyisoprenoid-binding protein YceI
MATLVSTTVLAAGNDSPRVEIQGGTASFEAATNVPAIQIHGKSSALEGRARIRYDADGLVIEGLEAALPVRTLNTGMGLRDEHMRKYVFATADGLLPDVRFVGDRGVCSGAGRTKMCQISGDLIIRDTARPFTIDLKVSDEGPQFRASGDGVVKLSTYGITPPSQLGVRALDDVKLRVDFIVKRVDDRIAHGTR